MLWPIVVPFQITSCVLLALLAVATVAAPMVRCRRLHTFLCVGVLCLICFIPLCGVIMRTMDANRFGVFVYKTFNEVQDFRVERYLPPAATDITVDKYAQGFRARFSISQSELNAFMDRVWERHGDQSVVARGEIMALKTIDIESHSLRYGDLGWEHLRDATELYSPTAGNGAGFSIWFCPSKSVAYQRAGYW